MEVDEIYAQIRENLDKVKEREKNVSRKEEFVAEEERRINSKSKALEESKIMYEQKAAELEKEKLTMSGGPVEGEEIVELNVQGVIMSTRRNTLTQFTESRLAYTFNGRWDEETLKDSEGRVFLDVQPSLFRKLLDYLTTRNLVQNSATIPSPQFPFHEFIHFKAMLQYFGIETEIYPNLHCFSATLKSRSILLSPDASLATNISEGTGYVLGEDVYTKEMVKFSLIIESLGNPWMFIGVMSCSEAEEINIEDNSFNKNSRAYGWADKGGLWSAGIRAKNSECTIPAGVLVQGTNVEMTLDCASRQSLLKIALNGTTEHSQVITLPTGQSWRLHINLVGHKDAIRLVNAERQSLPLEQTN
eukprot:g9244.t1